MLTAAFGTRMQRLFMNGASIRRILWVRAEKEAAAQMHDFYRAILLDARENKDSFKENAFSSCWIYLRIACVKCITVLIA